MSDVRILKPAKTAMQSGKAKSKHWVIRFDSTCGKFKENLMGWTGALDNSYQLHLTFLTKEDAISFAEKQGYSYEVVEEQKAIFKPKSYASNFDPFRVRG